MEVKAFDEWALVEVMGHQQYAGRVTEQVIGGASFLRVDVPECEGRPAFTKILGAGSIFCITPCSEEVARAMALRMGSVPLSRLALPAPVGRGADDDYDDYPGG